ncbi:MAG: lipopolysaccharide heptosyltransferase II [Gammaproteobacteria bacterium]|nr:lipopolysaccharide heptosyltransferase II [Gammaproteobacteria bacterium]
MSPHSPDISQARLIVSPAWVGDIVMAQSLFKILKRRNHSHYLDILAPPQAKGLLERMPEVRHVIPQPVGHGQLELATRRRIARKLEEVHYRQAIVLPNSFKSALIPFWANIPCRTGYTGEFRYGLLNDIRPLNKVAAPGMAARFAALGFDKGMPLPSQVPHPRLHVSEHSIEQALLRLKLDKPVRPLLALCPGAEYGPAKRWPEVYFAEVAKHKIEQGWQVWLFGSEKDAAIGKAIQDFAGPQCVNLCGRTELAEAVDLLSLAQAAVSNDSGLMHVASALEKPLIAIYGSSDPGFTPPLNKDAHIVSLRLKCSPCFKRKCFFRGFRCLKDLHPDKVIALLDMMVNC